MAPQRLALWPPSSAAIPVADPSSSAYTRPMPPYPPLSTTIPARSASIVRSRPSASTLAATGPTPVSRSTAATYRTPFRYATSAPPSGSTCRISCSTCSAQLCCCRCSASPSPGLTSTITCFTHSRHSAPNVRPILHSARAHGFTLAPSDPISCAPLVTEYSSDRSRRSAPFFSSARYSFTARSPPPPPPSPITLTVRTPIRASSPVLIVTSSSTFHAPLVSAWLMASTVARSPPTTVTVRASPSFSASPAFFVLRAPAMPSASTDHATRYMSPRLASPASASICVLNVSSLALASIRPRIVTMAVRSTNSATSNPIVLSVSPTMRVSVTICPFRLFRPWLTSTIISSNEKGSTKRASLEAAAITPV